MFSYTAATASALVVYKNNKGKTKAGISAPGKNKALCNYFAVPVSLVSVSFNLPLSVVGLILSTPLSRP